MIKLSTLFIMGIGLTTAINAHIHHVDDIIKKRGDVKSPEIFICNAEGSHCHTQKGHSLDYEALHIPVLGHRYNLTKKEIYCLAQNIMQEADKNSPIDRIAVAHATINRVKDKRFPNSICEVVFQKGQMSWTKDKKRVKRKVQKRDIELAKDILWGVLPNPIGQATNWYNYKLDSAKSFNHKLMKRKATEYHKLSGSVHTFIKYGS